MPRVAARTAILSSLVFLVAGVQAHAAARVFVSVNGNDANPCENIGTPCRTFAGGIARVDADGEVIVLDNGSYGGTTITKAVHINVPSGVVAFAAQPFVINVPGGVVVLRGLTLKALTVGSGVGITYTAAAALHVENCVVDGWSNGLEVDGTGAFFIKDSIFRNMNNNGVLVQPPSAALIGSIDNSRFENNFIMGVNVFGGSVSMRNSVFSSGQGGYGAGSQGISGFAELNADKCIFTNNGLDGLFASGATGISRISNSIVTHNGTGLHNFGVGAILKSWGNNAVDGNTANTTGTITIIALQ